MSLRETLLPSGLRSPTFLIRPAMLRLDGTILNRVDLGSGSLDSNSSKFFSLRVRVCNSPANLAGLKRSSAMAGR